MTEALTLAASPSHRSMCLALPRALCTTSYNGRIRFLSTLDSKYSLKRFFSPSHT
jgi:hypothetical protein